MDQRVLLDPEIYSLSLTLNLTVISSYLRFTRFTRRHRDSCPRWPDRA